MANSKYALRDLIVAVSLANLCFLKIWHELLYSSSSDAYWQPIYNTDTYIAILLNVAVLSLVFWVAAQIARATTIKMIDWSARIVFLAFLIFPLNYLRSILDIGSEALYWLLQNRLLAIVLAIVVVVVGFWLLVRRLKLTSRVAAVVLLIFAPFAALTLGQSILKAVLLPSEQAADSYESVSQSTVRDNEPRVVFVLFDEFDYRVAFAERPDWVELPNFDKLRSESFFAVNARGRGKNTAEAVPSYLIGKLVKGTTPVSQDDMSLEFDDGTEMVPSVKEHENIFSDVTALGMNSAVVGYYHPYCRLFRANLTLCVDHMVETYTPQVGETLGEQIVAQLVGITPLVSRITGIDNYHSILDASLQYATNPSMDFVFIHSSVPHGPDIYNLTKDDFSLFERDVKGYFGNLVLADRFLGELVEALKSHEVWGRTTIVVTSDHEWRRSANFDGQRVDKIPYFVRFAGAETHLEYNSEFSPLLVSRSMISDILQAEIRSPGDLQRWLRARHNESTN